MNLDENLFLRFKKVQFLNTITTQRPNQIIYEMSEMCVEVIWSLTVEKTLITVCSVGLNFGN